MAKRRITVGVAQSKFKRARINRIMSAYVDDRPFSVELVSAILRQGSFVTKMHELQWTRPGFFDNREDEAVLRHCIARYMGYAISF